MNSIIPRFTNQTMVYKNGYHALDSENAVILQNNMFDLDTLQGIIDHEVETERKSTDLKYAFTPRYEVCYTTTGRPYTYSGVKRFTQPYPEHILEMINPFLITVQKHLPFKNVYTKMSNGINILYCSDFKKGGSVSAHSDDEMKWGLVIIFSLGQTRWLRIRHKKTKKWTNVKMKHNSIVCMHGPSFQEKYTHQVDKLKDKEPIGNRISINIRFLKE